MQTHRMQSGRRRRRPRALNEAGFTLLEVIIGLAIVAMAVGVLVRASALGLSAARTERDTAEAVQRARSRLAEISSLPALNPGVTTGEDNEAFRWRIEVTGVGVAPPYRSLRLSGGTYALDAALYEVTVAVSWNRGIVPRSVSLSSHVLVPLRTPP